MDIESKRLMIKQKVRNPSKKNPVFKKQILEDWEPSVGRRNCLELKRNVFLICRIVCFRRKEQAVYEKSEPSAKSPFFSVFYSSRKSSNLISSHVRILTLHCAMFIPRSDSLSAQQQKIQIGCNKREFQSLQVKKEKGDLRFFKVIAPEKQINRSDSAFQLWGNLRLWSSCMFLLPQNCA